MLRLTDVLHTNFVFQIEKAYAERHSYVNTVFMFSVYNGGGCESTNLQTLNMEYKNEKIFQVHLLINSSVAQEYYCCKVMPHIPNSMHTIMCTLSHAHTVNPQKKSIVFGGLQN
jgi:hypothetical protein